MKIQEVFNEYIELKPYIDSHQSVFIYTTLYNNYIKPSFGNREISTLSKKDYQNFANTLLSEKTKHKQISPDCLEQIIDVLVSIYRYALKAKYYQGSNLPSEITLKFPQSKNNNFQMDLR